MLNKSNHIKQNSRVSRVFKLAPKIFQNDGAATLFNHWVSELVAQMLILCQIEESRRLIRSPFHLVIPVVRYLTNAVRSWELHPVWLKDRV